MTTARSEQINLQETSYYHCITRCVRRSFLCGLNYETGQDYSHRKDWIVAQIKRLAGIFAIKVCAYAIMSNHYHLVLFVDKESADEWDEIEIRNRWGKLFYKDAKAWDAIPDYPKEKHDKIVLWNDRLMDISWFMRCLNETIARMSNKEDKCKGRFWEGRFKSQALLDEAAVLSAMTYVDLNPIRAKQANTPEASEYTSIHERIQVVKKQLASCSSYAKPKTSEEFESFYNDAKQPSKLMPFTSRQYKHGASIDFSLADYIKLVDEAGRELRSGKRGAICHTLKPIFERLNIKMKHWLDLVINLENKFSYAVGHAQRLGRFMRSATLRAPKGTPLAHQCYHVTESKNLEKHLSGNGNMKID